MLKSSARSIGPCLSLPENPARLAGYARYEYRFLVDGQWQNAPDAEVVPNPYGGQNCVQVIH